MSGCLLQVPRWSLHRRRLSWSILQVPSWSGRHLKTVADCLELSYSAQTILVPSNFVRESLGTGFGCRQSVKRRAVVM
ncbi:hypothetical protein DPMN_177850 [Dreissena polymorpha]|uniref:Uncharacterized protein n=1 Tax=Dreissena polymorpha TaxID=45954 RepID=A0A9D4EBU5_DREPO|nr:hypothetical protein DPMN_177850 [Dreissena polymorpha]